MGKNSTESHRPGDRNAFSLGQPAVNRAGARGHHLDYTLAVFSHYTIRGPRSGFRGQLSFPLNRFLCEKKENPMYARKVSLCSKLESVGQFLQKIEHQMVLLLRKQEGVLDQLILLSGSGETIYVYSFWDNSEDAEKIRQHNAAKVN
jgi:hypothetical protein